MNPYEMSQDALFDVGVHLTTVFLNYNGMRVPTYTNRSLNSPNKPVGSYGCGHYVWRLPAGVGTVWVNAAVCSKPARGTPRKFSFPGNLTDRTPVGVVAHEVGHHVDHVLGCPSHTSEQWLAAIRGPKVSSYEPNPGEAFAESMRVFILNPRLLEAACPKRFAYLVSQGLKARPTVYSEYTPIRLLQRWQADPAIVQSAQRRANYTE